MISLFTTRTTKMAAPEPRKPMSDVHAWSFRSEIDAAAAAKKLQGTPNMQIAVRDSEDEGFYVNARHDNGTRIRITGEPKLENVSLVFPTKEGGGPLTAAQRKEMIEQVVPDFLKRLGARDVKARM